jgi:hypothetical protein
MDAQASAERLAAVSGLVEAAAAKMPHALLSRVNDIALGGADFMAGLVVGGDAHVKRLGPEWREGRAAAGT